MTKFPEPSASPLIPQVGADGGLYQTDKNDSPSPLQLLIIVMVGYLSGNVVQNFYLVKI